MKYEVILQASEHAESNEPHIIDASSMSVKETGQIIFVLDGHIISVAPATEFAKVIGT